MIYLLQGERGKETGKGKTDGKDGSFSVNRFSFFSAARAPAVPHYDFEGFCHFNYL